MKNLISRLANKARHYKAVLRSFIFWKIECEYSYQLDRILSKLHYKETVAIKFESPKTALKKNLCIFSHFDQDNIIDPYVIYYLSELARCDCDIVFISASVDTNTTELEKIKPYCKKIMIKSNQGMDFAAYRIGIATENDLSHYDKVILANDSVYGPLFDIQSIINYGDQRHIDMWSASDSPEIAYHLQSYFIVFSKKLVASAHFKKFFKRIVSLKVKLNIIIHYEVGMSQYFLKRGFALKAFCDYSEINHSISFANNPTPNPTLFFWDAMIKHHQFPYVKREIFTNKSLTIDSANWQSFLKEYTHFDATLITSHLKRIENKPILQSI